MESKIVEAARKHVAAMGEYCKYVEQHVKSGELYARGHCDRETPVFKEEKRLDAIVTDTWDELAEAVTIYEDMLSN